ncbi:hypothetical protein HY604_00135 [Candidatus Peregrinibacteria bacterium]|nr:hypothetical protein [Candidatus Peregrinibacteria bacterium]
MKKFLKSGFIVFVALFLLAGCQSKDGAQDQREEPERNKNEDQYKEQIDELLTKVDELEDQLEEKEVQNDEDLEDEDSQEGDGEVEVEVENDPDDTFFALQSGIEDGDTLWNLPVIFKGTVSSDAEKVVVTAKGYDNAHNKGYKDVYTLKDFKKGDGTFTYRAKPEWKNMNIGRNDYEFEVFFEDGSSRTAEIAINYIYDGEGEIAFDGCGDAKNYKDYVWFDDLADRYNKLGLTKYEKKMTLDGVTGEGAVAGEKVIEEMCFAKNGRVAVFISSGSYCDSGYIYRYFTETNTLEQAKMNLEEGCNATFIEFLKRTGNIIPVKAGLADAGCFSEDYFDYDFIKNNLIRKKTFFDCIDDGEEGEWEIINN